MPNTATTSGPLWPKFESEEAELAATEARLAELRHRATHQEYPKWVQNAEGTDVIVHSEEEENALKGAKTPAKAPGPAPAPLRK